MAPSSRDPLASALCRVCGAGLLLVLLGGCATRPAASPGRGIHADPPRRRIIELALGTVRVAPTLTAHAMPTYPPELLPLRLPPRDIVASLGVDATGSVVDVHLSGGAPFDASRRRFAQVVRDAVTKWRFSPARAQRWAADAAGMAHPVDVAAAAATLGYAFHFAQRDGHPEVTMQTIAID